LPFVFDLLLAPPQFCQFVFVSRLRELLRGGGPLALATHPPRGRFQGSPIFQDYLEVLAFSESARVTVGAINVVRALSAQEGTVSGHIPAFFVARVRRASLPAAPY
jgi:hypothetical protein